LTAGNGNRPLVPQWLDMNCRPALSEEDPMKKTPLYKHLYVQVLFAIACGVLLGHFYPIPARQ